MYINEKERSVLAKICYHGPAGTQKAKLLRALYDHYAARIGELTDYDLRDFEDRASLEESMGADAAERFVAVVEKTFGAPYEELTQSGTLVRMRAALTPVPGEYLRRIDAFSAAGPVENSALRDYCLADADAVVFVADPRVERQQRTLDMWQSLQASNYSGPIVLLTIHSHDPDELVMDLDFDGPRFAIDDEFTGNLEAFEAAAKLAVQPFRKMN